MHPVSCFRWFKSVLCVVYNKCLSNSTTLDLLAIILSDCVTWNNGSNCCGHGHDNEIRVYFWSKPLSLKLCHHGVTSGKGANFRSKPLFQSRHYRPWIVLCACNFLPGRYNLTQSSYLYFIHTFHVTHIYMLLVF